MTKPTKRPGIGVRDDPVSAPHIGRSSFLDAMTEPVYHPPADVNETSEGLVIRMELPGVAFDEIEVIVHGNTVEIQGDKKRDASCGEANFLCLERSFGKFHRAFEMAGCLNMSGVTAVLGDGILVLSVPKCPERRGRKRKIAIGHKAKDTTNHRER